MAHLRGMAVVFVGLLLIGATTATAGVYEDTVLADNPRLYWQLGDESGATVATDATPYGRDGAYQGGASLGAEGIPLAETDAASFDGEDALVVDDDGEGYLLGETNLSLEIWTKADEIGTDRGIIGGSMSSSGDNVLSVRYDSGGYRGGGSNVIKIAFSTTGGVQEYESASDVQSTDWQHLVINWASGQGVELYVNGELDTTTYQGDSDGNDGVIASGGLIDIESLFIGESVKGDGHWLGTLDEFAVYDDPLTADQVQAHYAAGIPEPATMALLGLGGLAVLRRRRTA